MTLKLEATGSAIRFQPDTGAQCNVLPVKTYKDATVDHFLQNLQSKKTHLIAYGGFKVPVIGMTTLTVSRGKLQCRIECLVTMSDHS